MEYRLDKYRIIESDDSTLWWEEHFPMAMQRRGKCYVLGDILLIGKATHEESGYLILEFQEQLEKLPLWNKTDYYCYAADLLGIQTSESLPEEFLKRKMFFPETGKEGKKSIIGLKAGKFRLGQYQIIVTDNDEIEWQAHEGTDRVIGGRCIVESDVLFLGAREYDRGMQRKEAFISKLNRLPQWDSTSAWCKSMVLKTCQTQQQTKGPRCVSLNINTRKRSLYKHSSAYFQNRYTETVRRLLQSGLIWLKTLWRRIRPKRFRLNYLIPLVVAVLLLGIVMLLHSAEKKLHRFHFAKDHHHKRDYDKD